MKQYVKCEILRHEKIANEVYLMELKSEEIVKEAKCGQFVHIQVGKETFHIFRRPISICTINKESGSFTVIYAIKGKGTEILAQKKVGDGIDLIGPLGHGFTVKKLDYAILVGGGIGIPPLLELAAQLKASGTQKIIAYLGYRSETFLIEEFKALCNEVHIATEDGSTGHKGYVTELIKKENICMIYSCGPKAMLKKVQGFANENNIPCELSVEERMGCGIGACLSCVCKVKPEESSSQEFGYARVCKEGPVFDSKDILFD